MNNQTKNEIRGLILKRVVSYFEKRGVRFRALAEGNVMAHCPFHDDRNPSLSIDLNRGLWNCFAGCGGGDIFDFHAKHRGLSAKSDFPEIIQDLKKEYSGGHL